MTALTTDSDSGPDSDRDNRPPRQVIRRVFHAPDPLSSAPPFPPRISGTRGTHRNDLLHRRPETRPTLGAPVTDRNHLSDGSSHPHLTPQSLEMITAATIAALNQHLVTIGFLRVQTQPPRTNRSPPWLGMRLRYPRYVYRTSANLPPARFYPAHLPRIIRYTTCRTAARLSRRILMRTLDSLTISFRRYKRSTVDLTLAASREYSPFNFLPT